MAQMHRTKESHESADQEWRRCMQASIYAGTSINLREYEHENQSKKSVLEKVKSKAKKWKHALSMKKHDGHAVDTTPTRTAISRRLWEDVSSLDEDDNVYPEYHGAPMYESELVPESYRSPAATSKPTTRQFVQTRDLRCRTIVPSSTFSGESRIFKTPSEIRSLTKTVSDLGLTRPQHDIHHYNNTSVDGGKPAMVRTLGEMLAPGYNAGASEAARARCPGARREEHVWDKGVSVKEYMKQKLEPGEEEKALSQVISQAMVTTKAGAAQAEAGVVKKVKEAVSSMLGPGSGTGHEICGAKPSASHSLPYQFNPVNNSQPDNSVENSATTRERILQMN